MAKKAGGTTKTNANATGKGGAAGNTKAAKAKAAVKTFRHEEATRKNIPPAKIAAEGTVPAVPKAVYSYSPRRPPILRFDPRPLADRRGVDQSRDREVEDLPWRGVVPDRADVRPGGLGADGTPLPSGRGSDRPLADARGSDRGGGAVSADEPPRIKRAVPADELPELIAEAGRRPLTPDEQRLLAEALRNHQPWLEWAEKREQDQRGWFSVDPVALHIHERVSAQAILRVARRQDVQRDLFADPEQEYHEAVQFYRHDIDWTNRLILGDSLQVMSSLAHRENLAGKVQMIYIDPPYGIKFASNFQPQVGQRDVKDKEQDLTREPEMVKAYRDTWHLGIHSYLSYLRDRLLVSKELLTDTGSIFVQISDENLHVIRNLLDDVFGREQFCSVITFRKKMMPLGADVTEAVSDYILWYARDRDTLKVRPLFISKETREDAAWSSVELNNGLRRRLTAAEIADPSLLPTGSRIYQPISLLPAQYRPKQDFLVQHRGEAWQPPKKSCWKTDRMDRVVAADRAQPSGDTLRYVLFHDDYSVSRLTSLWADTVAASDMQYVVQTNEGVIQRCLLMTTDPGDLVLDPTCGSGTTADVAEQWGRRWITIDTSRVAVAIARQRLLTAKYEMFKTRHEGTEPRSHEGNGKNGNGNGHADPKAGFEYKKVPHITLKSIAQNQNLDPIFAKWEPILDEKLAACNAALGKVSRQQRGELEAKLLKKQKNEGKKSIADADRRRWLLPPENRDRSEAGKKRATVDLDASTWYHWEVPFDADPDWPKALQDAVTEYRKAWRGKMDEVNACISANADQEELVDQPEPVRGVVRVSGPFTVEAVQPPEMTLGDNLDPHTRATVSSPRDVASADHNRARKEAANATDPSRDRKGAVEGLFDGEPDELEGFGPRDLRMVHRRPDLEPQNVEAYIDQMLRYLRLDGVRFPNNKQTKFTRLERLTNSSPGLCAEGRWIVDGNGADPDPDGRATVAIAIGPQYGPVTAKMVEDCIRSANRLGYDDLVVAGFSFDGPAQTVIDEVQHARLRVHRAHIRPDVNPGMNGLLKEQPGSQLFTVFGQPRTRLDGPDENSEYCVVMEGVDIYNPVTNEIVSTGADKVAAWFIDGDYDGRTFCITQAFFPDRAAWDKLARALKGVIDEDRFDTFSGTESLPFPLGKHNCVAVKVIDPRGNEVMRVHTIE